MKKIIFLLLFPFAAFAVPGENIIVLTGSNPGFKPVNNTYYIAQGPTFITSSLLGGNLLNVTFDGTGGDSAYNFIFSGSGYAITHGGGGNVNVTLKGFQTARTVQGIFEGETKSFITYNGTPQSCLWYNLKAQHFVSGGKTMLYSGTWEACKTFHNVVIGWEFSDFVYQNDSTGGPNKIFGNSLYLGVFADGIITGKTILDADGTKDLGVAYIPSGNLRAVNLYYRGGASYLIRLWQVVIGPLLSDQRSFITQNIAADKKLYGLADVRTDPGQWVASGPVTLNGGNVSVTNNTAADNDDINGGYVTNLLVLGDMNGFAVEFNNNAASNCYNNPSGAANGQCLIKNNGNGGANMDSSNNMSTKPGQKFPAGYLDANYRTVPGGPLYNKMIGAGSFWTTDVLVCPPPVHDTTRIFIRDTIYLPAPLPPLTYTTLFTTQTMPTVNGNDGKGIEVGVKFRSAKSGFIQGVRFWKVAGNTGTHIGELYSSTGARLGAVTYTNETVSGWQTSQFSTPIPIDSGKTYVAACFSPSGAYSQTTGRFTTAIVNPPLTGLANGTDGMNGLYILTSVPAFPVNGYQNSDYGVDFIYSNR